MSAGSTKVIVGGPFWVELGTEIRDAHKIGEGRDDLVCGELFNELLHKKLYFSFV